MKQKLLTTTLAFCMITTGSLAAYAYPGHNDNTAHHGSEKEDAHLNTNHSQNNHGMVDAHLTLTEEQQEQIKAIHKEKKIANEAAREKLNGYHVQIRELATEEPFDEYAVRALAEEKAAVQTELTISKAKTNNAIQAILSTEQQEQISEIHSPGHHKAVMHHHEAAH